MTSSSEAVAPRARVLHGAAVMPTLATPELRTGQWARHAGAGLGDEVTEGVLAKAADEARRVARAQGWSTGWSEGVRTGRESMAQEAVVRAEQAELERRRLEQRLRDAEQALLAAARGLEARTAEIDAQAAAFTMQVAVSVTEAVLGHAAAAQLPDDVLRRALACVDRGEVATLRLAPETMEQLGATTLPDGVVARTDSSLGPADAVVEVADTVVDLRVDTALARVREVLR